MKFYRKQYAKLVGKEANILREDFCGTFALSCAWANLGPTYSAIGIDLDPEPIEYGRTHYLSRLKPEAQARVKIFKKNVLDPNLPEADLVLATNFSYYCIRKREELLSYYKGVYHSLKKSGVFFTPKSHYPFV